MTTRATRATKSGRNNASAGKVKQNHLTKRKTREEALQESELRYRRLFETAQDAILILDADTGKIMDANPFVQSLLGYSHKEFIGKHLWQMSPFKDIAANREKYRRLVKERYVRYEDLPLETKSGQERHVEFVSNVYKVGSRSIIQCNIRDISGRKLVEGGRELERQKLVAGLKDAAAEAERSRAQLEAVFQSMQDGLVVFDMKGNAVLVNEAEARINGFASAAEMKRNLAYFAKVYELREPDDKPLSVKQWPVSRVLRGESLDCLELRSRRKDTGREWLISFSGAPVYDEKGEQVLAVVITRDITQRKKAEEELKESEEKLRSLFESASDYFIYLDQKGNFLDVNTRALELIGKRKGEVIGKNFAELGIFPEEDLPSIIKSFRKGLAEGAHTSMQHIRSRGGQLVAVESSTSSVRGKKGVAGVMIVSRDITERIRMEDELKKQIELLEKANRLMIGRELRMVELKRRLRELEARQGKATEVERE